jgi:hypothetical protein
MDFELASFCIGEEITKEEAFEFLSKQIHVFNGSKWFIRDFIDFQYGELSEACKPHKQVIDLMKKHTLWKGYTKGKYRDKEKEKDKDKVKDKEKEKEKDQFHDHLFDKLKIETKQHNDVKLLFKHYTLDQLKGAIDTASLYHSKHSPKRGFKWGKNWTKFFENIDTFMDDDMYKARIEQELKWTNDAKSKAPSMLIEVSKATHTIKQFLKAGRYKGDFIDYDTIESKGVVHHYHDGKIFKVPEDKI